MKSMFSPSSAHPTYAVVCLHEACCQEAAQFIADRLRAPRHEGGAQLVVHQERMRPNGLIVHVSAEEERLLQLAEEVGVKKRDRDGVIRAFRLDERDEFPPSEKSSACLVGPLTLSDVHRCVLYAMEAVHFPREQGHLPGYPKSRVPMRQAPVLSAYREAGHIDTFPLHDDEMLSKLHARWKSSSVFDPPVEDVRDYFGENVALYVSFSSFYTAFLIPMAAIGLIQFALDRLLGISFLMSDVAFACLNLIAVTVFLEMWKRRSSGHEYKWGSGGKLRKKRPRPEFRGEIGINKITGKEEMQYPMAKTMKKVFLVSVPITLLCLLVAFFLMLASFKVTHYVLLNVELHFVKTCLLSGGQICLQPVRGRDHGEVCWWNAWPTVDLRSLDGLLTNGAVAESVLPPPGAPPDGMGEPPDPGAVRKVRGGQTHPL